MKPKKVPLLFSFEWVNDGMGCLRLSCFVVFCLFQAQIALAEQKAISPELTSLSSEKALTLIRRVLDGEYVTWDKVGFPYEMPSKGEDRFYSPLEVLKAAGVLSRTSRLSSSSQISSSSQREPDADIFTVYRYRVASDVQTVQKGELEYLRLGSRRVKAIRRLSPLIEREGKRYREALVDWYVDDQPEWMDDPALDSIRRLRRVSESGDKPFTLQVYLQWNGDRWAVWQDQ